MHTVRRRCLHLKPKPPPPSRHPYDSKPIPEKPRKLQKQESTVKEGPKCNALGVQLLSRTLHSQLFPSYPPLPPPPPDSYVQISREHLTAHGLDPTLASSLPSTSFTLPPLQGNSLSEHFHRIGSFTSHPYRSLALHLSTASLPPVPEPGEWDTTQSGWTKYIYKSGGASFNEPVPYPLHEGKKEEVMVFDVETMPKEGHPYPVLAVAASPNAWYAWVSPWLLGESDEPDHLIPLGAEGDSGTEPERLVVGHHVSFDRARVLDEYSLKGTKTRWLDTMSLHVAVSGISSHQRPAWNKYKKGKKNEQVRKEEAVEVVRALVRVVEEAEERLIADGEKKDVEKLEKLRELKEDMKNSLRLSDDEEAQSCTPLGDLENSDEPKRWEELTSLSSLVDVARLHCNIDVEESKLGTRNRLLQLTRKQLMPRPLSTANVEADSDLDDDLDYSQTPLTLDDLLTYCANDVYITHRVFQTILPSFLARCPHPVSFAGVLTMGSSFLTVNDQWEKYIENAERVYWEMEESVRKMLNELARDARELEEESKRDPWLSQLDWTPKKAGKSRGVEGAVVPPPEPEQEPRWYTTLSTSPLSSTSLSRILPLLLKLTCNGDPLQWSTKQGWYTHAGPLPSSRGRKTTQVLSARHAKALLTSGEMNASDTELALSLSSLSSKKDDDVAVMERVRNLAREVLEQVKADPEMTYTDPWFSQLDWTTSCSLGKKNSQPKTKPPSIYWPKWYWDLTRPKKDLPPGTIDLTPRNRIAPLLLKLAWRGYPLCFSREHGWCYRVPSSSSSQATATITNADDNVDDAAKSGKKHAPRSDNRGSSLTFSEPADSALADLTLHRGFVFYKLPHKDGEKANVGSPLGKTFIKYAADGTLTSPGGEAEEALDLSAVCSYWMSSRDRIMNQMVMWEGGGAGGGGRGRWKLGLGGGEGKWGMILPQVITMGTVTRRAIEKTWLTASNAKKNRVGSELKAMVRAPPGYAIVGADVDSEELWISSCMGDAQFGMHGATALGWMTLEGTKAAGTDLHSKTAKILGLSRDQAKVFNYSRIYGAGMKHAILLLLQANAGMSLEGAHELAENLYASTKGKNTHRTDIFERKFWFGGSESFVFNKLEEIANSEEPRTPALGCGVTHALSREYLPSQFGSDYMPSRINWVVQSSGVDYLHLLIVSMDYLIARYGIQARYLISVHDELRYLVAEKDKYRAALALQIANLWTRAMFAYRLGMDDLPQGVAFFSAVDVDTCLRKEVDMECVTPSQPVPIPPGESLGIEQILEKTEGGSLGPVLPLHGSANRPDDWVGSLDGYENPDCLTHRCKSAAFLRAQATSDFGEVKGLAQRVYGVKYEGGIGGGGSGSAGKKPKGKKGNNGIRLAPVGNGEGVDWSDAVEQLLRDETAWTMDDYLHYNK